MSDLPGSAYVHFPFCVRKCSYCDFVSFPQARHDIPMYMDAVTSEVRHAAEVLSLDRPLQPLDTVFVGGGTPSLADGPQLSGLLDVFRETFGINTGAEISLEANPGTVNADKAQRWHKAGFNRISIGFQAVQPWLLERLGRIHTFEEIGEAISIVRKAGFDNVGADIMFGLPGQTQDDVRDTLQFVLDHRLEHISFYSLQVEPDTPMQATLERGDWTLPDSDTEREMYDLIRATLSDHGVLPYEISNAARPGYECRHNKVYWSAREYYGFGCAAHGYVDGRRQQNTPVLPAYLTSVADASPDCAFPAASLLEIVDRDEQMKETMMLGFRLDEGILRRVFYDRFGVSMESRFESELTELQQQGLIAQDDRRVALTPKGRDLANQVFMAFV